MCSCWLNYIYAMLVYLRSGQIQLWKGNINTSRPKQNGRHFADDIFKWIFLNANVWIPIKISLKFVPEGPINNISALVQIMAWRRPGDKPLSGPMMVRLPTHICITRPQWVNHHETPCIFGYIRWTHSHIEPANGFTHFPNSKHH